MDPQAPTATPQPPIQQPKRGHRVVFWVVIVLVIAVCSGTSAYAAYYWQHQQVMTLQTQVSSLQSQLTAAQSKKKVTKKSDKKKASPSPSVSPTP